MIRKVAVVGAGASGAAAAAALKAEESFDVIKVFERRESAGGTWIYDQDPDELPFTPGALPPVVDQPLDIPSDLPRTTSPSTQYRYEQTPIYQDLTTNVPDIAMCLSDIPFPYGPFVPHWIPRQYIENYFSSHQLDHALHLNTTVEDISKLNHDRWSLTLRRHDAARHVNEWWEEEFDAVVIANGHYSVPFVPQVPGIDEYRRRFPDRIQHSKTYRAPRLYTDQRVLVIGNSASGYDVAHQLNSSKAIKGPLYVSRRTPGRWDGADPPPGIVWKPVISKYEENGNIIFADGSVLKDIDRVIYCTGYQPSYPFWNQKRNGRPLYDYKSGRLINNYQHTFLQDLPTIALVGFPRVLTFRSFEYQAVAIARLWSGRATRPLPPVSEQKKWELRRADLVQREHRKFHAIGLDGSINNETTEWFSWLFEFAGMCTLDGKGRCPPIFDDKTKWALNHIKKYPEYRKPKVEEEDGWEVVGRDDENPIWFI